MPNISRTAEDTNHKFSIWIDLRDTTPKNIKNGQKRAWPRSRDLLFKFCWPPISLERLKIQISNFASRLIVRDTK